MKAARYVLNSIVTCGLMAIVLSGVASGATPSETTFRGPWHTTNRKLDGVMTCTVTRVAEQEWRGRFFGSWNGVAFDHTVAFTGPPEAFSGTAIIDGAHYDWTGEISVSMPRHFKGSFGGDRYAGWFDLQEQPAQTASPR
jgi:hypothetical protein